MSTSEGLAARDEALARVEEAAGEEFMTEALWAVLRVSMRMDYFTTDDVWEELTEAGLTPSEPRVMGAVMTSAKKMGYCKPTDFHKLSRYRIRHGRPMRVWQAMVTSDE